MRAARLLGIAVVSGGGGGIGIGAGGGDVLGPGTAAREQIARLGLGEPRVGGSDPCRLEPIVEPRQQLAGPHGVAFIDQDLGDPALGLERELDRIVQRLDPARRDQHARPCGHRFGVDRRGRCAEPPPGGDGEREGEEQIA